MKKMCLLIMIFLIGCVDNATKPKNIYGCTDSVACNFNPDANVYAPNSCIYDEDICEECSSSDILGCTDSNAINYNSNANCDNGTCFYSQPEEEEECLGSYCNLSLPGSNIDLAFNNPFIW